LAVPVEEESEPELELELELELAAAGSALVSFFVSLAPSPDFSLEGSDERLEDEPERLSVL
jgi:hypothetical protein